MSLPAAPLRFASPNERRTITREDLGLYNALVIAAVYEFSSKEVDVTSHEIFTAPLKFCIQQYPFLGVAVKDKHTERPFYEVVSTIDLENHINIIQPNDLGTEGENDIFQKVLPPILDRPWPADLPPWRIVVLPLASKGSAISRCFVSFAFSHALGDGMVGVLFHRTFLEAWQQSTTIRERESFLAIPPTRTLPAPFDTPERLPISWRFLLGPLIAVYLPKVLNDILGLHASASPIDAGTWTGSPIFFKSEATVTSRVRLLEIDPPLLQNALRASRSHDTKLTATLHQLIIRALGKVVPSQDVTNFVSGTPVDMRGSIGALGSAWGLYVSGYYEMHPRQDAMQATFSDEMWTAASSMTKSLAECAMRLQDQAIGLLRYVPSIRDWMTGKLGDRRDSSYELSNLLAFDGASGANDRCRISKMVFLQPGNALSAPLVFNLISVKGGSLVIAVSWQIGALGVPVEEEERFVDEICSSLRADVEALDG
ncbi:uncharacterized protein N7482_006660 [Penicillium canariense]|uniref:Alcohol acetyltransferase n=1 Tax=Penicillium canariense TaxID=189055 RepID=A0A9W9HXL5_9EURO|nr:uncharacterized protein N7482_006660 [Penicillium canariense]KAJ5159656.1 hypothetical protein N7482_006660 [Penicillium canariense]